MSIREVTSDDIEKLRNLLRSSAWNDVVLPALEGRKLVKMAQLVLDPDERKGQKDETIRGGIQELQWVMTRFEQVVREFDHNQRIDDRDAELAKASP